MRPFLGEPSSSAGPYAPDPDFGYTYRSLAEFRALYAEALAVFDPLDPPADSRPVWALFGNSFVQAPGMLADSVQERLPGRRVFRLGRNEPLELRLAQAAMLLDHGFRPERLLVALMPIDCVVLGARPLATIRVTRGGAVTYEVRRPRFGGDELLEHSRLALMGWVRSGRHVGNPGFRSRQLLDEPGPTLVADLRYLFRGLARAARKHGVPLTVLLIPAHQQITAKAGFGFQEAVAPALRAEGIDVLDLRATFDAEAEKDRLFLPDKHFTRRGNELLADALVRHVRPLGLAGS